MTETTRASVEEQISSFAEGDLEYAKDMLSALWDIVSKDGRATATSNFPSGVSSLQFSRKADTEVHFVIRANGVRVLLTGTPSEKRSSSRFATESSLT